MAYLNVSLPKHPQYRKALEDKPLTVGRALGNELWLDDHRLSRQHCRFERRAADGKWIVSDLQSRNGTYVNDRKIAEPFMLKDGDVIVVGDTKILFNGGKMPTRRPTDPSDTSVFAAQVKDAASSDTMIGTHLTKAPRATTVKVNPKEPAARKLSGGKPKERPVPFRRPAAVPIVHAEGAPAVVPPIAAPQSGSPSLDSTMLGALSRIFRGSRNDATGSAGNSSHPPQ